VVTARQQHNRNFIEALEAPGELEEMMNADDADNLLKSLTPPSAGFVVQVGVKNGAAFWKIASKADPGDYAVVWTPGDRWFALDVRGGFSFTHFEEEATEENVSLLLLNLTQAARAYVEGRRQNFRSRLWKIPRIRVDSADKPIDLRLSPLAAVGRALRLSSL
jgi:hypothetical protein